MILSRDQGSAGQTNFTMATSPLFSRALGRISRDEQSPTLGVRYLKIPDEQSPTKEGSGDDDTSLLDIRVSGLNLSGVTVKFCPKLTLCCLVTLLTLYPYR
jgi:hypothetical protein